MKGGKPITETGKAVCNVLGNLISANFAGYKITANDVVNISVNPRDVLDLYGLSVWTRVYNNKKLYNLVVYITDDKSDTDLSHFKFFSENHIIRAVKECEITTPQA